MRTIVALSGGKASAWCADWALKNYPKDNVTLYFNDTKWEHPDLYRFLDDLSTYFNHGIYNDSDGRSPEQLFHAHNALANNRMPFCSQTLKAERLQAFVKPQDIVVFGISNEEAHRANRIERVYEQYKVKCLFPLIENNVTSAQVDKFILDAGIEEPYLYKLGFSHNNCSGGCVRAGKKQWIRLLKTLPDVYEDRMRVEEKMREKTGKDISYKDETLRSLKERYLSGKLSKHYDFDDEEMLHECVGICATLS